MNVLRVMLKYVGYYILIMTLIAIFASSPIRGLLITLCGAALSVSMFAAIIQLLFDGSIGAVAEKVSAWCLRSTAITTAIVVIAGIGLENIGRLFIGG